MNRWLSGSACSTPNPDLFRMIPCFLFQVFPDCHHLAIKHKFAQFLDKKKKKNHFYYITKYIDLFSQNTWNRSNLKSADFNWIQNND